MTDERILEMIETKDKYFILGFIKGLKVIIEELQQENQQLKKKDEVINDTIEFIKILVKDIERVNDGELWVRNRLNYFLQILEDKEVE